MELSDTKRSAIDMFSRLLRGSVPYNDVRLVVDGGNFEVFVIVDNTSCLKDVLDIGLEVYRKTSVHIPIQVISNEHLERWREQGNQAYDRIIGGTSIA